MLSHLNTIEENKITMNEPVPTSQSQHFLPGDHLKIRKEWRRAAAPDYRQIRVSIPGRLHFAVFDFSKMAPGLGGGGLGISTNTVGNEVIISSGRGTQGGMTPSARHLLALFQNCTGYSGDDISIQASQRIEHAHGGFGSNVSFNTAVIAGLNALFGFPYSIHELWDMLTQNFIENTEDQTHVYLGLDTGVGEACFLYGGLVWIDEGEGFGCARYLGSVPATNLWVVTGVGNLETLTGEVLRDFGKGADMSGHTEADVVAKHCMQYHQEFGSQLKEFLHTQMRPALVGNNLRAILSLGWKMNQLGNMKALEGIYETEVLRSLTKEMHRAGALYAGMSSAGPGYFAFAESQASALELQAILEKKFASYFGQFGVGRAGERLTMEIQQNEETLS